VIVSDNTNQMILVMIDHPETIEVQDIQETIEVQEIPEILPDLVGEEVIKF
jgi:hypothetical protein